LLVVEGSLAGGLDMGLRAAVQLAEILSERFPIKLTVAGAVDSELQRPGLKRIQIPA
jgi:hypothetical protein